MVARWSASSTPSTRCSAAVAGQGMTHAWLFTGPPGSGRSNVGARLRRRAAVRARHGCGECHACRTALAGSHPDVSVTRSETSMLYIDDMRELVHRSRARAGRAALAGHDHRGRRPARRRERRTGNTLLKAIEEPTPKTVWLLCAPTVEDVLPTIRSRCRNVIAGDADRAREVTRFLVERARRRRVGGRLRGAGQPGPHRPGPGAGLGREDPQPAPRGRRPARRA